MTHPSFARFAAALALLVGAPTVAEAAPDDDGVYGRLDGDLALSLGAGVGVVRDGALGAVIARAVFVESVGLYATYADSFGGSDTVARTFSTGVELRPLFLVRFASNLQSGPPTLDMAIDSLAIGLGAHWTSPSSGGSSTAGLELGAGFEVPLFREASGPWIGVRGVLRWGASDFAGTTGPASDRGALALLTLSWQKRVTARIADAGDIRPQ